jgi:ferritin-like metal-binding protein YciE
MPAQSLQELFVEELRDMYDAEKRLTKALPKMARATEDGPLRAAFTTHLKETERQVARLEQVFRTVGEKPRGKKCDGMIGIIEEGNTMMEELERGPVLDAALIAGAQKSEHYEIASYGTLAYYAELLGNDRAKELLGQTLDEEKATDEKLNMIAKSDVNCDALMGAGEEQDEEEEGDENYGVMRNVRRAAASFGVANDAGRSGRGGRSAGSRSGGRSSGGRSSGGRSAGRKSSKKK